MKKKIAGLIVAGAVALTSLAGVATYAYFSDVVTSGSNTFDAGTIKLTSTRQDLPITGPMFYTESNTSGILGTGYWKPGMNVNRVMFIKNGGSLPARINYLEANLLNPDDFTQPEKNMFLRDMKVRVWRTKLAVNDQTVDVLTSALKDAQNTLDAEIANGLPAEDIESRMEELYNLAIVGKGLPPTTQLSSIHKEDPLSAYVDGIVDSNMWHRPILNPGETVALIYQVTFKNNGNQNILQGKEFNFDFTHTFKQTSDSETGAQ